MDAVVEGRRRHLGPNVALSYAEPIEMVSGSGCYLFDQEQRTYLDCVNNVAHVGHSNPQVAAAVCQQMATLNTNARYLSKGLSDYTAQLAAKFEGDLEVVYMVNSGSEANDLALRMAQAVNPGADHVVVLSGAYHGHLSSLIPLSPYKFWGTGGSGKPDWVHVIPCPDSFRGLHLDGTAAAQAALAAAAAAGGRVSMFIAEAIPSCGGQMMLPPGYLQQVYRVMQAAGVVCVADEVQTGFGRVGDAFWAYQLHGVSPDIVTLGKPIGNGFPLGAVVTSRRIASAFCNGMEYFNTYGGCNAAVAAGSAVLQQIEQLQLQQHAAVVGRHLKAALEQLQQEFLPWLGDVRGVGLFLGVEVVRDQASKLPAPQLAKAIKEGARARRVLLSCDGPYDNVIKIKPPMVFGLEEADLLVQTLREVVAQVTAEGPLPQLQALEQQHYEQVLQQRMAKYETNAATLLGPACCHASTPPAAGSSGGQPAGVPTNQGAAAAATPSAVQQWLQQAEPSHAVEMQQCGGLKLAEESQPHLHQVPSTMSMASTSCSDHTHVPLQGESPTASASSSSSSSSMAVAAASQAFARLSTRSKPLRGGLQGEADLSSSPGSDCCTLSLSLPSRLT